MNDIYKRITKRGQFILGPSSVDHFESWKRIEIGGSMRLTAHPDLNILQKTDGAGSLTLIGYIIDPDSPFSDDQTLLENLFIRLSKNTDYFEITKNYAGRWVLIIETGDRLILFHDPAGLRQVYYCGIDCCGDVWCASHPGLIADILGFRPDKEAIDFIESFSRKNNEYWWPGDSSHYKEIRHLLPNHYLDLKTASPVRYWPTGGHRELYPEDAIESVSNTMSGLMKIAANRFDLALGLSSGLDSRVVLACSREIRHEISYYNAIFSGMKLDHADIVVPRRLLSKLNMEIKSVESFATAPDMAFLKIFRENVPFAHEMRALRMQANLFSFDLSKVAVTGSILEVGRCFYRVPGRKVKGYDLAMLTGMGDHPFARRHFEAWLEGIRDHYNYKVLDLFYWEQRIGRWFAMNCLEFDIAWLDVFVPCNSRQVLVDLLSVDERYRVPHKYILFQGLIRKMWPDLLCEPISPHKMKKGRFELVTRAVKRALRPMGLAVY